MHEPVLCRLAGRVARRSICSPSLTSSCRTVSDDAAQQVGQQDERARRRKPPSCVHVATRKVARSPFLSSGTLPDHSSLDASQGSSPVQQ